MAVMIDQKSTYHGEAKVWQSLSENLSDDIVVYNNREINGREYDFCLMIEGKGISVIEVKGWVASKVKVAGVDDIIVEGCTEHQRSPKKQARSYRFAILDRIKRKYKVSPLIYDLVAYPFISEKEYFSLGLNIISEPEVTLFKEDLENRDLLVQKMESAYSLSCGVPHTELTKELMNTFRTALEPNFCAEETSMQEGFYSRLYAVSGVFLEEQKDKIIREYFEGTKQYLFTDSNDTVEDLKKRLKEEFKKRNIEAKENRLFLGSSANQEEFSGENLMLFQFELYYVKDLSSVCPKPLEVIEGDFSETEESILQSLSKETTFNFQQYQVVHAPADTNTLVEAGAGTGKTYSMVQRAAFLCCKSVEPITDLAEELAMVTFTNEAANNMKRKLKQMFVNYFILTGKTKYLSFIEDVDRANISTIHKFALEILRRTSLYTGLGINFRISSDEYTRKKIYDTYLEDFLTEREEENPNFINELPVPVYEIKKKVMNIVDHLMQKSVDLSRIKKEEMGVVSENNLPYFNELIDQAAFPAEREYLEYMQSENKMDLKEAIILLNRILDQEENLLRDLKLKYLFIDEFQDTDDVQIEVFQKIQKAVGGKCRLFVVGDLKQSIYRFRGAKLSAFKRLQESNYYPWDRYYLSINYRTDRRLLDFYDILFQNMGQQSYLPYAKKDCLTSRVDAGGEEEKLCQCIPCHAKDQEKFFDVLFDTIKYQKEMILELSKCRDLRKEERTIAVLVRSNWQVERIASEAASRGIRVEVKSGGDLFRLSSTKDLYKLVLALENSRNPVYLINFMESDYIDLKIDYRNLACLDEMEKTDYISSLLDRAVKNRYGRTWSQLVQEVHTQPVLYVLKKIFDAFEPWKQFSTAEREQREYIANYEFLLEKMIHSARVDTLTLNQVKTYLEANILSEQSEASRTEMEEDEKVHILCTTVHKSKGLEYGTVILPYTYEDISDLRKVKIDANYAENKLSYTVRFDNKIREKNSNYNEATEADEQIAEEARILYVALTRAIRNTVWILNLDQNDKLSWGTLLEA